MERQAHAVPYDMRLASLWMSGRRFETPVIVAVFPVRMVEVPLYQIVRVVAMNHGFMSTVRPMNMVGRVGSALVFGCTTVLIHSTGCQRVFLNSVTVHMVEMTVVEIIDVAIVPYGSVAAIRTMDMGMFFFLHVGLSHCDSFLSQVDSRRSIGIRIKEGLEPWRQT
jgi:hypothetical protein